MSFSRSFLVIAIIFVTACSKFEEGEKVFINISGESYLTDSKASGTLLDMDDGYALINIEKVVGNPKYSRDDFGRDVEEGQSVLVPESSLLSYIEGEKYWAKRAQAVNQLNQALERPTELWYLKDLQLSQIDKFLDEYDHTDITNTLSLIELNRKYFSDLNNAKGDQEKTEIWLENLPGYYSKLQKLVIKSGSTEEFYKATEKFKKSFLGMTLATEGEKMKLEEMVSRDPLLAAFSMLDASLNSHGSAFVQISVLQAKTDLKRLEEVTYQSGGLKQIADAHDDYQDAFVAITSLLSLDVEGDSVDNNTLETLYNKQLASGIRNKVMQDLRLMDGFESIAQAEKNFAKDKEAFESIEDEIEFEIFNEQIKQEFYIKPTLALIERNKRIDELKTLQETLGASETALTIHINQYNSHSQAVDGFPIQVFQSRLRKAQSELRYVESAVRYINDRNPSKQSLAEAKSKMTKFVTQLEGLNLLAESYLPGEIYDSSKQQELYEKGLNAYSERTLSTLTDQRQQIISHKNLMGQLAILEKADGELVNVYNQHYRQSKFPSRAVKTRLNELKTALRNSRWSAQNIDPLTAEGKSFNKVSTEIDKGKKALSEANTLLIDSIGVELKAPAELFKVNEERTNQANQAAMQAHQALLDNYDFQKQRLAELDSQYEQFKGKDKFPHKAVRDRIYKAQSALRSLPHTIKRADPLNKDDQNTATIETKVGEAKANLDEVDKLFNTFNQLTGSSDTAANLPEKTSSETSGDDALASYKQLMNQADATKQRLINLSEIFEEHKGSQGYPVSAVNSRLNKAESVLKGLDYNIKKADPLNTEDTYRQKIREDLASANEKMDEAQKLVEAFSVVDDQSTTPTATAEQESIAEQQSQSDDATDNNLSKPAKVVEKHNSSQAVEDVSDLASQGIAIEPAKLTKEAQIDSLLKTADSQYAMNKLTSPAGDCAVESYKSVLNLSPNNQAAIDGLNKVAEKYAGWGSNSLNKGEMNKASSYLAKAKLVMATNSKVNDLEKAIKTELAREVKPAEPERQADVEVAEKEPSGPATHKEMVTEVETSQKPLSAGEQFKEDLNTLKDTVGGAFGKLFN